MLHRAQRGGATTREARKPLLPCSRSCAARRRKVNIGQQVIVHVPLQLVLAFGRDEVANDDGPHRRVLIALPVDPFGVEANVNERTRQTRAARTNLERERSADRRKSSWNRKLCVVRGVAGG